MLTNKGVSVLSSPRGCVQSQIGFDLDFLDLDLFDFHPSFNLEPFDLPPFDLATSQLIGPASGQHIENTEEPGEHNGIHAPARMSRIRKRKAPSIEDKDWERMKSRVIGLYCIENRPLKEVRDTIMQEFGFNATERQYKSHMQKWGLGKNVNSNEMKFIAWKRLERQLLEPDKADRIFKVRGRRVPFEKIERWTKRVGYLVDRLDALDPRPVTPDGLSYRTASESGSAATSPGRWTRIPIPSVSPRIPTLFSASSMSASAISTSTSLQPQCFSPSSKYVNDRPMMITRDDPVFEQCTFIPPDTTKAMSNLLRPLSPPPDQSHMPSKEWLDRIYSPTLSPPRSPIDGLENQVSQTPISHHSWPAICQYRQSEEEFFRVKLTSLETNFGKSDPILINTLLRIGSILMDQGRYAPAEIVFQRAARISQYHYKDNDIRTLKCVSWIMKVWLNQGRSYRIHEILQVTINRLTKSPGSQDSDMLTTMANLAWVYRIQGRWGEAEGLEVQVMNMREEKLGPGHPHTLESFDNLACLQTLQGKYQAADVMSKRAFYGRRRYLNCNHPDTLKSAATRAWVLRQMGEYKAAEKICRLALKESEKMLGYNHPDTLRIANVLHLVLFITGDIEELSVTAERVLHGIQEVLGFANHKTFTALNGLACVRIYQEMYGEAELLFTQALEAMEKCLGPTHPFTLVCVNNLALALHLLGRHGEAEILYNRSLEGREMMLGPNHPETLESVSQLAQVLSSQGKDKVAEAMGRRVLGGRERLLGPRHPKILDNIYQLAWILERQEKYQAAEVMGRQILEGRERILGLNHLEILHSVGRLVWVLGNEGRYEVAEVIGRQVLEGREKILGPNHLETLHSISQLAWVLSSQGKYEDAEAMERRLLEERRQ